MSCSFCTRLTAPLNVCPIYIKVTKKKERNQKDLGNFIKNVKMFEKLRILKKNLADLEKKWIKVSCARIYIQIT